MHRSNISKEFYNTVLLAQKFKNMNIKMNSTTD